MTLIAAFLLIPCYNACLRPYFCTKNDISNYICANQRSGFALSVDEITLEKCICVTVVFNQAAGRWMSFGITCRPQNCKVSLLLLLLLLGFVGTRGTHMTIDIEVCQLPTVSPLRRSFLSKNVNDLFCIICNFDKVSFTHDLYGSIPHCIP